MTGGGGSKFRGGKTDEKAFTQIFDHRKEKIEVAFYRWRLWGREEGEGRLRGECEVAFRVTAGKKEGGRGRGGNRIGHGENGWADHCGWQQSSKSKNGGRAGRGGKSVCEK